MNKRELYRQVAELHVANINRGFLSTLGIGFVALMYRAIDECENSIFFVEEHDGRVIGFVAGATGMGPIYKRMLRYWPRLIVAMLPSMVFPRRIWRIFEIMRYGSGKPSVVLPNAELLSIAVDAEHRGQGHAEALYRRLVDYFQVRGDPAFKITVGNALAPAHKFYLRMGAVPVTEIQVHKGELSTVYVHYLRS